MLTVWPSPRIIMTRKGKPLMKSALLIAFLLIGSIAPLCAQSPDSVAGEKAAANSAYEAKDWAKAELLYERIAQAQPDNFRSLYRLGVCRQNLGQHQKALEAFQTAQAKGMPVVIVGYNMAVVYASLGQTDHALGQLAEVVKQGYGNPDQLSTDPGLAIDSGRCALRSFGGSGETQSVSL